MLENPYIHRPQNRDTGVRTRIQLTDHRHISCPRPHICNGETENREKHGVKHSTVSCTGWRKTHISVVLVIRLPRQMMMIGVWLFDLGF